MNRNLIGMSRALIAAIVIASAALAGCAGVPDGNSEAIVDRMEGS